MQPTAAARDLRSLHQSMIKRRQRPRSTVALSPHSSTHRSLKTQEEELRIRSLKEHTKRLENREFDSIQSNLVAKWDPAILQNQDAAAILLKTEHDLHFWEPLQILGISESFRLHRRALEEDQKLLNQPLPNSDEPALQAIWEQVLDRLQQALGVVH